jgi:hypothetical protein
MGGIKSLQIAAIWDGSDLSGGKTLGFDEIPGVRLRYGNVAMNKTTGYAIGKKVSLQPPATPQLPDMRGFQDQWHTTQPTDWRGDETGAKQVRMQDIHAAFPQDLREAKRGGELIGMLKIQRQYINISRQIGLELRNKFGMTNEVRPESISIKPPQEQQDVFLDTAAHRLVREIENIKRPINHVEIASDMRE